MLVWVVWSPMISQLGSWNCSVGSFYLISTIQLESTGNVSEMHVAGSLLVTAISAAMWCHGQACCIAYLAPSLQPCIPPIQHVFAQGWSDLVIYPTYSMLTRGSEIKNLSNSFGVFSPSSLRNQLSIQNKWTCHEFLFRPLVSFGSSPERLTPSCIEEGMHTHMRGIDFLVSHGWLMIMTHPRKNWLRTSTRVSRVLNVGTL